MNGPLTLLAGALVLAFAVACGSADEGSGAGAAQVAELSQFPTPTRSQAAPKLDPQPTPQAATAQTQADEVEVGNENAEITPMTQEELQQLRQKLQSGELSEGETAEAVQRLRAQFGGGQGGGGFGGRGGSQTVGNIETIEGGAIAIATEVATVTARVGEDTNISITSILEPTALTDAAQVMVVSERVEGSNLARAITIITEAQGGLGLGRFGGGQGGAAGFGRGQGGLGGIGGDQGGQSGAVARPLIGTIESINNGGFTLGTQQGPLPIAIDEETLIVQTRQGTLADLEAGMQIRVTGAEDENGEIDARSVIVTPEELEDVRGFSGE